MMKSFFDRVVSVASDLLNYVSGIGSRIRSALSFGGAEGVSGDPMGTGAIDGQRAKGGPISRGATYLVGERGPELITAGRAGYVDRSGPFPAGGITVAPAFNMSVNGRTDPEDVVQ